MAVTGIHMIEIIGSHWLDRLLELFLKHVYSSIFRWWQLPGSAWSKSSDLAWLDRLSELFKYASSSTSRHRQLRGSAWSKSSDLARLDPLLELFYMYLVLLLDKGSYWNPQNQNQRIPPCCPVARIRTIEIIGSHTAVLVLPFFNTYVVLLLDKGSYRDPHDRDQRILLG
jgi:hypothetical protein